MSTGDQLREWVAAYLTQTLDEADATAFQQRLEVDKSARVYFAEQSREDVLLYQCLEANALKGEITERIVRKQKAKAQVKRSKRRPVRKTSSPFIVLVAAAAAFIAIIVGWQYYQNETHNMVKSAPAVDYAMKIDYGRGNQIDLDNSEDKQVVKPGDKLLSSVVLETADDSMQLSYLRDDTHILIGKHSSLAINVHDDGTACVNGAGSFNYKVAKQKEGHVFTIECALGSIHVVGTEFDIKSSEEELFVSVKEGVVIVAERSTGAEHRLTAGQHITLYRPPVIAVKEKEPAALTDQADEKPESAVHTVTSLSLINSQTNNIVSGFENVTTDLNLNAANLGIEQFNIRINAIDTIDRVLVWVNGKSREEKLLPFSVFSDTQGDYKGEKMSRGVYVIKIQTYVGRKIIGLPYTRILTIQ